MPFQIAQIPENVTRRTIYLAVRQVPEIDGSQGAFIGLVVALSVLIVGCCAAVFYLLRHHEPSEQERAARRERYRRTREQTLNSNSSSTGPLASKSSLGSLGDKVKRLWQSGGGQGRRGGRGWIRAGSDDEWASHSDRNGGADVHADAELGGRLRALPVLKQDQPSGAGHGVHIVESPSSDTTGGFVSGPYVYADPFSKTTMHGLQRSQSPLSSPVSSPRGSASADESHEGHSPRDDPRHRSAMSNISVWSQAGSKFVEDI